MKSRLLFLCGLGSVLAGALRAVPAARGDKRVVSSPEFPRPLGPYFHAVVSGGFVFICGGVEAGCRFQQIFDTSILTD
jgi:hypothetical protein